MKHVFIRFALMADAATSTAPVETNAEKLARLKSEYIAAHKHRNTFDDPFTEEAKAANLAVWKIEGEMKAVNAAIEKEANDAKLAELRNERLAMNAAQFTAYDAFKAEQSKKNPDTAKLAELETAFKTAKELVDNELLAKFASSKPAKKAEGGDSAKSDGGDSANKAAIIEMYRAGKTHKDIEAEGYKRSTVWHTINNAIKSGEVTKQH